MKTKITILITSVAIAVAAVFTVYNVSMAKDALLRENVKAMAVPEECPDCGEDPCVCEDGGQTSTTWNCNGGISNCSAHCGQCGTEVSGSGKLSGSHSCK